MSDQEKEIIQIQQEDVIEEPTFEDDDNFIEHLLQGTEDSVSAISDIEGDLRDSSPVIIEKQDKYRPIFTTPILDSPEGDAMSEGAPKEARKITADDPHKALTISMRKDAPLAKALSDPRQSDKLLSVVRDKGSNVSIIEATIEDIAEEAAFIKAWRNENWDTEKDISQATYRRVQMLSKLVEAISEKEKIRSQKALGKIDFFSDNFQRVLKYFLEVIQKTFKKVNIPSQFEDIFFTQLAKDFDGFEKKAEKIYYGKDK